MVNLLAKWRRATAVLSERLGRAATPDEVSQSLGLSKKKARIVTQAIRVNNLRHAAESVDEGEDAVARLLDERGKAADDVVVEADGLDMIFRRLGQLEDRQAQVIRMRFGLDSYAPMTLRRGGRALGPYPGAQSGQLEGKPSSS